MYHFADDTNLLNINLSPKRLQKYANIDLKLVCKWLLANKITLNSTRTEVIFFHKVDNIQNPPCSLSPAPPPQPQPKPKPHYYQTKITITC